MIDLFRASRRIVICALSLAIASTAAIAADSTALEQFHAFSALAKTLQADFTQTQTRSDGRAERSTGRLTIAQPGKFRWTYLTPYQQTIVSDGKTVWFYDVDLEQVIVRTQAAAIGDRPAMLLSDAKLAETHFQIRNLDDQGDGLAWLEATPREKEGATFSAVRIGFSREKPVKLVLKDLFGQQTIIEFAQLKTGVPIDAAQFTFRPPKGVDILTE